MHKKNEFPQTGQASAMEKLDTEKKAEGKPEGRRERLRLV